LQETPDLLAITRTRALVACADGARGMAVNGRPNRRVACVLDREALAVEIFDLEGSEDEEEGEEDDGEE
jgi:anaphase-promoting complex subunit 4